MGGTRRGAEGGRSEGGFSEGGGVTRSSAIFRGSVSHRRRGAVEHSLSYGVWYLLVDLDEIDAVESDVRGFAQDKRSVAAFHAVDHGPRDGSALRPWAEGLLREAGVELEGGPIRLLTFPRLLGYAFNPITVWFCHGPLGDLRGLIFEVSNTFGEWHHYVQPVEPGTGLRPDGVQVLRTRFDKRFFVSPFITMDAGYDISVRVPDGKVAIAISVETGEGQVLQASFTGTRLPLDTRTMWMMMFRYPLLTLKVIGGIHVEALKLWRKGAPYRRRGLPPAEATILPLLRDDEPVAA